MVKFQSSTAAIVKFQSNTAGAYGGALFAEKTVKLFVSATTEVAPKCYLESFRKLVPSFVFAEL